MAESDVAVQTEWPAQETAAAEMAVGAATFGLWLDGIISRPFAIPSGYDWGDPIRAKRVEEAIYDRERFSQLAWRTSARLLALGVQGRRLVSPKVGLALLRAATMEYDDELHALWANLLASAVDPEHDQVERQLVSILADLTVDDVRALESIYADRTKAEFTPFRNWASLSCGRTVAGNLNRLGLIEPNLKDLRDWVWATFHDDRGVRFPADGLASVVMTELGVAFCVAVGLPRLPRG